MRYIQHIDGSAPETMSVAETTIPQIAATQVLVKVHAFGVNRADTLQRQGKYPPPPGESPILGLEVAGVVEKIGASAGRWKAGDRVMGLVAGGGYAEYAAVNADHLMPLPDNLSMAQGAAISEVFLTAYQSVFALGHIQQNDSILIHAGASGVGLAAIQLCRGVAKSITVTSSSQTKLDLCEQMGANLLINYKQQDFAEVMKAQKVFANVIVDFVGGDYLNRNLAVLARDGRIVYLAMLAGRYADKLDMAMLLGKRASIVGSTLRNRSDQYKSELIAAFEKGYLAGFANGELVANVDTCFLAQNIAQAHTRLEQNDSIGKFIGVWEEGDLA